MIRRTALAYSPLSKASIGQGLLVLQPRGFIGDLRPEAAAMLLVQKARAAGGNVDHLAYEVGDRSGDEVIEGEVDVIGVRPELRGEMVAGTPDLGVPGRCWH